MKAFRLMTAAVLTTLVTLTGCAFLQKNQLLAMVVVQQATTRFIEEGADKPARAANVRKVAEDIKQVAESDKVSLEGLRILALEKVTAARLQPSDHLLAVALVEASAAALQDKVKTGELPADAKMAVTSLLDWIISATALYA